MRNILSHRLRALFCCLLPPRVLAALMFDHSERKMYFHDVDEAVFHEVEMKPDVESSRTIFWCDLCEEEIPAKKIYGGDE